MGKYCSKCGNELSDHAKFCNKCGQRVNSSSEQNDMAEEDKRIKYENTQESKIVTKRDTHKKWWQRTGGIIFWLVVFFPIGLYLMWRYADWKRKGKVIVTLMIIVFFCWPFGSNSGGGDENEENINEENIIEVEDDLIEYGAAYNCDWEEAKEKVGKILSNYYDSDIELDECEITPYQYGNGVESYTYTMTVPKGYRLGVELASLDNKLFSIVVKTEYNPITDMNSDGLGDIQEIYSMTVNSITNDKLSVDEIKDIVKTENVEIDYYRNGNVYGICRTNDEFPGVFYYIVSACTDKKADETGCQKL